GVQRLMVAGGVPSNKVLRKSLAEPGTVNDMQVTTPSPKLCTENAPIIGIAAHDVNQRGRFADLAVNGHSNTDLEGYSAE
ncbi:tRNA (adenosine(37)-N6)-threonylcarbamoyltransferase complex transferase subunit TsaD, partial [Staphylococcus aureus]